MSYGISIVNENNQILIDQDFQNPGVVARDFAFVSDTGKFTALANDGVDSIISPIPYLTAVRPRTGSGITIAAFLTGLQTVDESGFYGDWFSCHPLTTHPPQEFVLFGAAAPQLQDPSDYGLKILNPSGETVYDSRRTYLEIVDVVHVAKPTFPTEQHYTHVALDNAFYVISTLSGYIWSGAYRISAGIRQDSATQMTIKAFILYSSGGSIFHNSYHDADILVCRLSGGA